MFEFFYSPGAFETHDALRSFNAVLAMWCLGLLTGMWPHLIRPSIMPIRQLWAGGWLMLSGLIIGSWEAVHLDTPPTVRTPIFTVALIVAMAGIIRLTRHPRPLRPYLKKPPRPGDLPMSKEDTP